MQLVVGVFSCIFVIRNAAQTVNLRRHLIFKHQERNFAAQTPDSANLAELTAKSLILNYDSTSIWQDAEALSYVFDGLH